MQQFLRNSLPLVLCFLSFAGTAQVAKLSDNTALNGYLLNNKPILTSEADSTLWTTDGTAAGTAKYTAKTKYNDNAGAGILNNKLYFSGSDGSHGYELWVTDGTDAGTSLIKDIVNGGVGSDPSDFAPLNNRLLFFADNGVNGKELWITDGTSGNTRLLKDINSNGGSYVENRTNFFLHKGALYFIADDGEHGAELWKTDGTANGTVRISDINPSGDGFTENYTQFFSYNNQLFFGANNGSIGTELWKTDGTLAGTQLVKDIRAQSVVDSSSSPSSFLIYNNKLYFTTNFSGFQLQESDLWVTDGTTNGTMQVKKNGGPRLTLLQGGTILNGKLIFTAFNLNNGYELWVSDGTADGTKILLSKSSPFIFSRSSGNENGTITNEAVYNGKIYFFGNDDLNGRQLWSTDGTVDGTKLLSKIYGDAGEISEDAYPSVYFTKSGIFFTAIRSGVDNKIDIFKTNGTAGGTRFVASLDRDPTSSASPVPLFYFIYKNQLYFSHDDGSSGIFNYADFYKLNETVDPLPVTLISFTAALEAKVVKLDWATATEINTSHFEVERSVDASHFVSIARVNAAGNSSTRKNYTTLDGLVLQTNTPVLYYRLKMVDKDGTFKYSRLAEIQLNNLVAEIKLSPNPAKDIITLTVPATPGKLNVMIADQSGKAVYQNNTNDRSLQINVQRLSAGIYYLKVMSNDQVKTIKFVKN